MSPVLTVCCLLLGLSLHLSARTWTNAKGQSVEGDFVRMDGEDHVVLKINSKEHRMAVSTLSEADQEWLNEQSEGTTENKPKNESPGKVSLLGVTLKPGPNVIPFDTSNYPFEDKNKEHSAKSVIHLHLPKGFDPTKQYNLMVTLGTSSGKNSKQSNSMRHFGAPGVAKGWVVMTSDSVKGRPPNYGLQWRITMIDAALDVLNEEWPASVDWNIAAGGSSGGAKAAQGVLACMGSKSYGSRRIAGLFLTGCNEEVYSQMDRSDSPSRKSSGNVAVFFSQGKGDKVAPPSSAKNVLDRLKKEGIRTQNYVEFQGGHGVHAPHVAAAFKWLGEHCAKLDAEL